MAGVPGMFEVVASHPDSPMPRREALEMMVEMDGQGWRAWVEHMATGKRAGETAAERAHQQLLKRLRPPKKMPPGVTSFVHKMYDD